MSKWKKVRLGDLGKVVTGNTPSTNNADYYESNDIEFYKPNDLVEDKVNKLVSSTAYISLKAQGKVRLLPQGSVLTTCIGIIGKVGIIDNLATCNQQFNAIIPNQEKIESSYLAYSILNKSKYLKGIANAAVVPIINKTQFSNVEIVLPPIEVQRKIAETLDAASVLITLRKKQLTELDNLIKAIFHDMFGDPVLNEKGWDIVSLKAICNKITDGTSLSRILCMAP